MASTRRMTPGAPASQHTGGSDGAKRAVQNYNMGYQDAVNTTVGMSRTKSGGRALDELRAGDPKPYRQLARRKNTLAN
jgi:hypothetical protein